MGGRHAKMMQAAFGGDEQGGQPRQANRLPPVPIFAVPQPPVALSANQFPGYAVPQMVETSQKLGAPDSSSGSSSVCDMSGVQTMGGSMQFVHFAQPSSAVPQPQQAANATAYPRNGSAGSAMVNGAVGVTQPILNVAVLPPGVIYGRLSNFQIEKKIGRGQFSVVHKARNLLTGTIVALKNVKVMSKRQLPRGCFQWLLSAASAHQHSNSARAYRMLANRPLTVI